MGWVVVIEKTLSVKKCAAILFFSVAIRYDFVSASNSGWSAGRTMNHTFIIDQQIRVQLLTPLLLRIEERGEAGFEDRPSFHVLRREWPGVNAVRRDGDAEVELTTMRFRIRLPLRNPTLEQVRIERLDGSLLFSGASAVPAKVFLPDPSALPLSWAFSDAPRVIPPAWGALPPPEGLDDPHSGWDVNHRARDTFVFLPLSDEYRELVQTFLELTGRIALPPISAFGLMDSRYYPYRQDEALGVIDTYRRLNIPLSVFVLDTDWRIGASHGYGINTELIPDMAGFVNEAHARGVRVMLNDHPEPQQPVALDPKELRYRFDGLTSLLAVGVDYWWFDRNWHTSLGEPAPGLSKEVWGMRLYYDIAAAHRPTERVLIMSNVEGIDNGMLKGPSSPAAHRFPIWWTGDTHTAWPDLQRGVRHAVHSGVRSLLPYLSEDLGGHHGMPDEELYARFVQFGALSPVCRLHCTANEIRYPWHFGEAGEIAAGYIRLRHRLLPYLYSAARAAFESGTPLLRRGDIEWPGYVEAQDDSQYLLGPDLLVAPVMDAVVPLRALDPALLQTSGGKSGVDAVYFPNAELAGDPAVHCVEEGLSHLWPHSAPHPGLEPKKFSARWIATLGPVAESGLYRIAHRTSGRVQMWLDDVLIIAESDGPASVYKHADVSLEAGRRYAMRVEYRPSDSWLGTCELLWGRHERNVAARSVWLPPGEWFDVWSGARVMGPVSHTVSATLAQVPLFVRAGGVLPSVPLTTGYQRAEWPELTIDWFVSSRPTESSRSLYEDDGHSRAYLDGVYRETTLRATSHTGRHSLQLNPVHAGLSALPRYLKIRIHGLARAPTHVAVNGESVSAFLWTETRERLPLADLAQRGAAAVSGVVELSVPPAPSSAMQTIDIAE